MACFVAAWSILYLELELAWLLKRVPSKITVSKQWEVLISVPR